MSWIPWRTPTFRPTWRVAPAAAAAVALTAGALAPSAPAVATERQGAGPADRAGPAAGGSDRAHTDVLFVGAHPDDEFQSLSTFGQWKERDGLSTGVVTITRGEGGGNATGPEEGAELGLLREREERRAVRHVGIENVYSLDKPDFWYTLSAPLTHDVWEGATPGASAPTTGPERADAGESDAGERDGQKGGSGAGEQRAGSEERRDTLERLVRIIRATTPSRVVTMDPSPFDQHGGHQLSGRLAAEAFQLAGDPTAFPQQLEKEGYRPWQPSELLAQNGRFEGPSGRKCADEQGTDPQTGLPVRGVWNGAWSKRDGTTWAQVERNAEREYRTQGFHTRPEKITTPREKLGCDWFSVLAEDGEPVEAPVREQSGLRPLYEEFRDWSRKARMPWLANEAQPDYPAAPSTTVPETERRPTVDGEGAPGEYPAKRLRLGHWQGEECSTDEDCSATARLSRHGDSLYVLVRVKDDTRGAALEASDCKRHWRTDSVEIALDPRGTSDSTATTFKAGILPFTADSGPACAARDGDNRQGPAEDTAPGMEVASSVTDPYTGYTVEARIPLKELPAAADPERLTANILVYDSDTGDKTGQSRLGWSTYGSAQADPYVWGGARLEGYQPPPERPETPDEPEIPREAAQSRDSLPSVLQSLRTGVPLAGGPRAPRPH